MAYCQLGAYGSMIRRKQAGGNQQRGGNDDKDDCERQEPRLQYPPFGTVEGQVNDRGDHAIPHHLKVFAWMEKKADDQQRGKKSKAFQVSAAQEEKKVSRAQRQQNLHSGVGMVDASEE